MLDALPRASKNPAREAAEAAELALARGDYAQVARITASTDTHQADGDAARSLCRQRRALRMDPVAIASGGLFVVLLLAAWFLAR